LRTIGFTMKVRIGRKIHFLSFVWVEGFLLLSVCVCDLCRCLLGCGLLLSREYFLVIDHGTEQDFSSL